MILLSPSKTFSAHPKEALFSIPFPATSQAIAHVIQPLSEVELQARFKVSPKIAQQIHQYYLDYGTVSYQVGSLYAGEAFKSLDYPSLSSNEKDYAKQHLRIFSTLYGLLSPQDAISKYRLDFKTKLHDLMNDSLHQTWKTHLHETLTSQPIINLSSQEFSSLLDPSYQVMTIDFKVIKQGQAKTISQFAKHMRGAMARKIIQEATTDPKIIKTWNIEGYCYDPTRSDEKTLIFTFTAD